MGGICHGHKTLLIFIDGNLKAKRYSDNVLTPIVLPFVQRYNVTFQQGKARPHVARICMEFLATNPVNVLPWPAYISPDQSPIEHIWDILHRRTNLSLLFLLVCLVLNDASTLVVISVRRY